MQKAICIGIIFLSGFFIGWVSCSPPVKEKKVIPSSIIREAMIHHGSRDTKKIALTFDADMTIHMREQLRSGEVASFYDERLIEILRNSNTKATLFLSGLWIEQYPEFTKELAKDSLFELANHSYSHPSFSGYCYGLPQLDSMTKEEEVVKTQKLLEAHGVKTGYFRFPGGCFDKEDIKMMKKLNMTVVHWDVVANDGFNNDAEAIINTVLSQTQNGSIIVMHMNGFPNEPKTAEAVPVIIERLRKEGFVFVTVSELVAQ